VTKSKRRHPERDFTPTHPHAAAIDIGSRMHVAAVPPDRDTEPVRAFGTCTGDLQQLADWFERCGVRTVAMESTGVYWLPATKCLSSADSRWCWSTPATPSMCRAARPMSATPNG
jgi:transposase